MPPTKTVMNWAKYMGITFVLCLIPGVNVLAIPAFLLGLAYPMAWTNLEAKTSVIEINKKL